MGTIIRFIPALIILYCVWWMISFQINPNHFCQEHPDPEKKQEYYLCEPFGFDFPKGEFERRPEEALPWEQSGYKPVTRKNKPVIKVIEDECSKFYSDPQEVKACRELEKEKKNELRRK